jgi:NAD(P)H-quinone oxidoreductase subunit L
MAIPFSDEVIITLALYVVLGGTYLLVIPGILLFYLKQRWYDAGSVERTILYAMVFVFFPGMLLFSPFVNFRPQPRTLK